MLSVCGKPHGLPREVLVYKHVPFDDNPDVLLSKYSKVGPLLSELSAAPLSL